MDTHNREGVLIMDNLLLNPLAVHHSRAPRDLKKERPDQADLLVSNNNVGETVTAQKQPTGSHQKNSEHFAHYLLTIMTIRTTRHQASNQHQKNSEHFAHYQNQRARETREA